MKSYDKKKKSRSSSSDVPQFGAQKKQSIEPLRVQQPEQQDLIAFLQTSKLTTAEVAGQTKIPTAKVTRWHYELGKFLVPSPHSLPRSWLRCQRKRKGYMTCTCLRCRNASSCRAQRLKMKSFFVGRPLYG